MFALISGELWVVLQLGCWGEVANSPTNSLFFLLRILSSIFCLANIIARICNCDEVITRKTVVFCFCFYFYFLPSLKRKEWEQSSDVFAIAAHRKESGSRSTRVLLLLGRHFHYGNCFNYNARSKH